MIQSIDFSDNDVFIDLGSGRSLAAVPLKSCCIFHAFIYKFVIKFQALVR